MYKFLYILFILFMFGTVTLFSQNSNVIYNYNSIFSTKDKLTSSNKIDLKNERISNEIDTSRKLFSLGFGTSFYRMLDVVFISLNVLPHLGQRIYIQTGVDLYGASRELDYTRPYFALNLSLMYSSNFSQNRIRSYFGGGITVYVLQGVAPMFLARIDYAFEALTLGTELRYTYVKGNDKFFKFPVLIFNFLF